MENKLDIIQSLKTIIYKARKINKNDYEDFTYAVNSVILLVDRSCSTDELLKAIKHKIQVCKNGRAVKAYLNGLRESYKLIEKYRIS